MNQEQLIHLGPPVIIHQSGPMTEAEKQHILDWGKTAPCVQTKEVGLYADNSKPNKNALQLQLFEPEMRRVYELMHQAAERVAEEMFGKGSKVSHICSWLNKVEPGCTISRHQELDFTCDITVAMHMQSSGGELIAYQPLPAKVSGMAQHVSWGKPIPPIEGQIVAFPGYVWHEVGVNESNEDRYSIASRWSLSHVGNKLTELTIPDPR